MSYILAISLNLARIYSTYIFVQVHLTTRYFLHPQSAFFRPRRPLPPLPLRNHEAPPAQSSHKIRQSRKGHPPVFCLQFLENL